VTLNENFSGLQQYRTALDETVPANAADGFTLMPILRLVRQLLSSANPFLLLHASILEPYLDLRFVESERHGDLHSTGASQIPIEVELFFQFGELLVGEVRSAEIR